MQSATHPWRRFASTHVDTLEASAENSFKQLHSLEAQFNANAPVHEAVPSLDPDAPATDSQSANVTASVAEQYHRYKQHRASQLPH